MAMFDHEMRYLAASVRWREDFSLSGDLVGLSHYVVFPEVSEAWRDIHRRCLAGETLRNPCEAFERAGGAVQWLTWEVRPWWLDDGVIGGVIMFSEEITQRVVGEIAVRASEERFRKVVEAAPNAMVMINQAGCIVLVNVQAEILFGYPRGELLGCPVEVLAPSRFRDQHPQARAGFFAAPESRPMGAGRDLFGQRKDGGEFPVEIGLNPIDTEDGPMVLSSIIDISDRKQKEARIEAALKEKDILLAEVHHRVKNNLQVVHSLLDLQSGKVADPAAQRLLRECQLRIRSMSLIHQTLYQSKDFSLVDFRLFLDQLVRSLVSAYSVEDNRVTVRIETADLFLPINLAVPCGLIVNELISNALKHGFPDGRGGEIELNLSRCPEGEVVLSVCDTGIGLPAGLEVTKAETLGLQLVTMLAEQLGAALTVNPRGPTRFRLQFQVSS